LCLERAGLIGGRPSKKNLGRKKAGCGKGCCFRGGPRPLPRRLLFPAGGPGFFPGRNRPGGFQPRCLTTGGAVAPTGLSPPSFGLTKGGNFRGWGGVGGKNPGAWFGEFCFGRGRGRGRGTAERTSERVFAPIFRAGGWFTRGGAGHAGFPEGQGGARRAFRRGVQGGGALIPAPGAGCGAQGPGRIFQGGGGGPPPPAHPASFRPKGN